ncbi:MAG TPA: DUF4918 family protein [Flavipsychrobacter sp.]|nr:DUF4918 family protein [Flavipsychrobacter sp.]
MKQIAERVISFYKELKLEVKVPTGVQVLNPHNGGEATTEVFERFYRKYYNDTKPRKLVLGINPGRFGAGVTGIPFTDPKRLVDECGIPWNGPLLHEPSSVFVYDVIKACGGAEVFYSQVYISSVCPLGLTRENEKGRQVNYNYYDSRKLTTALLPFLEWNIARQQEIASSYESCYCLGKGTNYKFLSSLNKKKGFFKEIIPLDHPRYIVQYKQTERNRYIDEYLRVLLSNK